MWKSVHDSLNDICRWNKNPYKWTIVPRVRHKVFKVRIVCELLKSNRNVKDKLLRYESYRNEVSGFPVAQSFADSRKYPIFQVALLPIVFYRIDALIDNLHRWPPSTGTAHSLLTSQSKSQAKLVWFVRNVWKLTPDYTCLWLAGRAHLPWSCLADLYWCICH